MRCKKHPTDLSSSVGVCSSCLRERLFALIAAQAQPQAQLHAQVQAREDRHRKSDTQPPPLLFPRSASPNVSGRKSDNAAWPHHNHILTDQRFYSTPQVGPTGSIVFASSYKKKHSRFSFFSYLFRSKAEESGLDPRVSVSGSNSGEPCAASSSSPSWFSTILPSRRKKQSRTFSLDESAIGGHHRPCQNPDRGMSPARHSDEDEDGQCYNGSSGSSSESCQGRKQTPWRTTTSAAGRRGSSRPGHSRNVSGLAFCLSPLVRASPSRQWNQKGMPSEIGLSGEIRVPAKSHLSTAASFCKNRSRKLADFGRFNDNH